MEQLTLNVSGMTCGGCEHAIKRAVTRIDGVSDVTASHAEDRVTVDYDASKTTRVEIVEAIRKAGYSAALP
jgi:copper chaperone